MRLLASCRLWEVIGKEILRFDQSDILPSCWALAKHLISAKLRMDSS